MSQDATLETLQRTVYREFLLEPGLYDEVGLEQLPARLASLLGAEQRAAIEQLLEQPLLEQLSLPQLKELLTIRDMTVVSRTAAALSAELKDPAVSYHHCCRMALCYAVIGMNAHVLSALRAAAAKNDRWARHHYLYALVLGIQGSFERARWEAGMALQYEPYEEGRQRIHRTMDILEGVPDRASAATAGRGRTG